MTTLLDYLEIGSEARAQFLHATRFPLLVPKRLADKMVKGDPNDPILRQFVPRVEEAHETPGFSCDPVADADFRRSDRLLKKYGGRVLFVTTSACAMHCRYCFRQNFDYAPKGLFEDELNEIRNDGSIHEVILSGGDALSLPDRVLEPLLHAIDAIPHVTKIRFHTRFPIGIPERIDSAFLAVLAGVKSQMIFVVHVNHPRELDGDVLSALKSIQRLGIPVLNQSVLLRGVNDSVETQVALSEMLTANGVIPYYLHQLDRIQGGAHFEVDESEGLRLIEEMRSSLPGYGVPRYVREVAHSLSKTAITSSQQSERQEAPIPVSLHVL